MRTQIAKTGYLPAEYIPPTFLTRTPSPLFRRFIVGAAIPNNFFIFFYSRLDSCFDSVFQIILFNYFDSIKIRHLILDFIFQTLHRFDSLQVITRHSPSVSFYIHHVWISRFQTLNFDSFLLVEFYSHQFRLVSALLILRFIS